MKKLLLFLLPFIFSGCFTSYPMGVSEELWLSLSKDEQLALSKQQSQLNHELALKREKNRTIEKQKQLEIELEKQKQLTKLYDEATLGNIVVINFEKGLFKYYDDKYLKLIPQAVILARGETKKITIKAKKEYSSKSYDLYLHYDRYGTMIEISFDELDCYNDDKLVILNSGRWDRGQRYKNNVLTDNYNELYKLNLLIRYHEATIDKSYLVIDR